MNLSVLLDLASQSLTLNRHQPLKTPDSVDTNLYYVESGSLRIFVMNGNDEQNIRFGYTGDFIIALDSFLTEKSSPLGIQALKKTVVKIIPKKEIGEFLESESNQKAWTKILENLILQQLDREMDLLKISPRERYESVLKRSPRLFQEIPSRHIANYLRMSPETLCRLKKS